MIDTTGQCSACGQTVGIDTIHTCSPQVTAPTPERRVGEARVAELAALEIVDEALGLSAEVQCQRILYNEKVRVARDLLDERAAVARLTAEVERLNVEVDFYRALQRTDNSQVIAALTTEVERLREIAEEAINAARLAWHEGYDDAVDPAWSEKQLRYAKVDAEPHEIKAVTHFFGVSDTKAWVEELSARLAALSLPTPAPEVTE